VYYNITKNVIDFAGPHRIPSMVLFLKNIFLPKKAIVLSTRTNTKCQSFPDSVGLTRGNVDGWTRSRT